MKIYILIGALLIGSALAQNSSAPTNKPKPTKPPKSGPVITCSNVTRYEPRACCPSYPSFNGKELTKCTAQCNKQNNSDVCCIANCTMNVIKAINADGSFNKTALAGFFVKNSHSKNKTVYSNLVVGVVQNCTAAPSNGSCPAADVSYCIYRQLFFQCPDLKNNTLCKSVYSAAQNCSGYPFIGHKDNPKSDKKNDEKKSNDKGADKKQQNKNQVNAKNNTTTGPTTTKGIALASEQAKKVQKAKEMKFPQTTQNPTTTKSGQNTTHKSESKDGALGSKGPGFAP
ncbi:uncharacterized protein [Chironomus tepperi]|uniref:uncharacterized protein n=1 Tax=Chironomus tepperi TaxID=113505 RepID=UPI00391F9E3D